jgi:hypothetical protein
MKNDFQKKWQLRFQKVISIILILSALSLTGCGSLTSWVTGASIATSQSNGDDMVTMNVTLNTGSISLIPVSLPILNPKNSAQQLGQVGITTTGLDVSLDLTSILRLQSVLGVGTLPNGTSIPVTNVNANNWIVLPIGNGASNLYLNLDTVANTAVVGVAVGISQLNLGVPADLLLPFSLPGVSGLAGIYTGTAKGQSGFAAFLNASSLLTVANAITTAVKFVPTQNSAAKIQAKVIQLNMQQAQLQAH